MKLLLQLLAVGLIGNAGLLHADWPDFRGPGFQGQVARSIGANSASLPLHWSETNNVTWKIPLPHQGWSTPVIQGNQIWLTTASEDGHDFYAVCVAADSGRILFNERIFHSAMPEPLGNRLNSYASCSPVIEAGRVYVHFGSYGTAGLDTETFKVIWKRDDLPCRHYRGPGSSPVLFQQGEISPNPSSRYEPTPNPSQEGNGFANASGLAPLLGGAGGGSAQGKQTSLPENQIPSPQPSPRLGGARENGPGRGLLILTMDGVDVQYLVALDKYTGKTAWKTERTANWNDLEADGTPRADGDFRKAYSTPLIVNFDGQKQMLSLGSKAAYSYDPATGREIWRLNHPSFSGASRPVFDGTNAFIATGHGNGEIICVRLGGQGDITDTHVVWRKNRGFPRMPSPLLARGLLFMVSDSGIASCLDARTGEQQWQERLGGDYAASLLGAGDRVYFFGQDGKATVVKAARSFEVLATNKLPVGFMASPAVAGRALILRTKTHLYRIEANP